MAARVYYYDEVLGRTTSTTTDYSTVKVTLSFTPNANKTYLFVWNVLLDGNSTSYDRKARLRNTTASVTLQETFDVTTSTAVTTDKASFGGIALYTAGASPSSTTFQIQVASGNVAHTLGSQEATLCALELIDGVDIWNASAGQTTISSVTYASKVGISWTPATAGDYLILAAAEIGRVTAGPEAMVRLNVNGSFLNIQENKGYNYPDRFNNFTSGKKLTNVSTLQAADIEQRSSTAANTYIREAYIVALRLDQFEAAFVAEDRTPHTSTSATYADSASVPGTAAAVQHLVVAVGQSNTSAADYLTSTGLKINAAESDLGTNFTQLAGEVNHWWSWISSYVITPAASSQTWKTQYARTVGTATCTSDQHTLAVLQLESAVETTTSQFAPDAIAASTNLTGAVATIQDDPVSPDGNWLTATSATSATDVRVTFPSPPANPSGTQRFNYYVRKTTGAPTPLLTSYLYQGGTLRATLENGAAVNSTTGELKGCDWLASALVTVLDGSDVECRIAAAVGLAPGALPAYDATGQAAAVVSATITTAITPAKPSTVNAGDLLILHVLARNDNSDGAGPATITGWTPFPGNPYGGTNNARTSVYWRLAGAGEANQTVSVTCSGGTTADLAMARIYRFTAANGFAAAPVAAINSSAGTTTTLAAPTITPTGTNQLAVCLGSMASSDATIGSMTGETGGNWAEVTSANSTTGGDGTLNVQTSDQSGGGAISGGTIAYTVSTSEHWVTVGFALVPANAGAATNTIEIGAIRWNATHLIPPAGGVISGVFGSSGIFGGRIVC